MKTTYWDLSESERANLTEAEVEKYGDFELMQAGVLKVKPLVLANVPKMPEPDLDLHVAMFDMYSRVDVASEDRADINYVISRCVRISSSYVGGQNVDVAHSFDAKAQIQIKRVYSEARFKEARELIERASAAKTANERAESAYTEACAKQRAALKGLWEDWHDCQAKHARLGQIINTWHEYVETAGSEELAAKFLAKAFDASDIAEAAEWWAIAIPLFYEAAADAEAAPARASTANLDAVVF